MRKNEFIRYISENNFKELFISEMGWNKFPKSNNILPIEIDGITYDMTTIAERNGFQVITCPVKVIPTTTACKKIDFMLRRYANDYICIFYVPDTMHHLWVAPIKKDEKRSIIPIEYTNAEQTDFLFSKIDDLTFDFTERTTIVDVKESVQGTFAVNAEKITKDFYTGFRKQHDSFAKFITGIDDNIKDIKKNHNKQWYASVMLNRLMFCYFIQKKGFLDYDFDYLQNKLKWVQKEKGENHFFHSFYKGFLTVLFRDGLNAPKHNSDFENMYGRIPYLNGGMFDLHQIERDYADIDIDDKAFEELFTFFDKWRWHLDTRITSSGKDINPDILGYIFEQYINDRAQMGAYYTKEDITGYIGKNCIIPFLMDKTAEQSADAFKEDGYVWKTLRESGERYIYDAVKKGYTDDWKEQIPNNIAIGLDTTAPNLLERRKDWNDKTEGKFALPTEIWRETIDRLQRCEDIKHKISNGEFTNINDFISYNLDIISFAEDLLAKADDHLFILHFYKALQNITILDPTCGSGAFLFAAMNILEPLYEACIMRMQEFNKQNKDWFKPELEEISNKYRSNIQYFIFKSIILRNLYGVDIMVEATEIAKLRLFLKMVSVVEVDRRADNLGLDPLPDIDFNIRCGNTLVGYANEEEINRDLIEADIFAAKEFRDKLEKKLPVIANTFEIFKALQLTQDENMSAFKQAKKELKDKLSELNDLLNHNMYGSISSMTYDEWLESHQPFHWVAEFYKIIKGNGGFDVIIGNPPYVEYNKKDPHTQKSISDLYKVNVKDTITCGNLYTFCIERCKSLIGPNSKFGMIVPLSLMCGERMRNLRSFIDKSYDLTYYSNFEIFPQKLFDGAFQRVTIFMCSSSTEKCSYTTKLHRWYAVERQSLFDKILYTKEDCIYKDLGYPKFYTQLHRSILFKIKSSDRIGLFNVKEKGINLIYYQEATNYWMKSSMRIPYYCKNGIQENPQHGRILYFKDKNACKTIFALLNSTVFYIWYIAYSDGFHLADFIVKNFPIQSSLFDNETIKLLATDLEKDIKKKSIITSRNTKKDKISIESFRINSSKNILDEIDKELAIHYGFTEEELDFIINYDIKYRMGDELNEE